jgi:hypothetical protein
MTRETKIGLVVSGSFLCLVGIVLFSKLRENPAAGTDELSNSALASATAEPRPVDDPSGKTAAGSKSAANSNGIRTVAVLPTDLQNQATNLPPGSKPPPKPNANSKGQEAGRQTTTVSPAPTPPAPRPTAFDKMKNAAGALEEEWPEDEQDNVKAPSSANPKKPTANRGNVPSQEGKHTNVPTPAPAAPTSPRPTTEPPKAPNPSDKTPAPLPSPRPTMTIPNPLAPVVPSPGPGPAAKLPSPPVPGSVASPGKSTTDKETLAGNDSARTTSQNTGAMQDNPMGKITGLNGDALADKTDGKSSSPIAVPAPPPPAPGYKPNRDIGAPPVPTFSNGKPVTGSTNTDITAGQPGGMPTTAKNAVPMPPTPVVPMAPAPKVELQEQIRQGNERSGLGSAPSPTFASAAPRPTPTESVAAVVKAPRAPAAPALVASADATTVISYDEVTHQCAANDSFRAISQKYYATDEYEQALLRFNQNHPLASEAVKRNPPVLQQGQAIYIPPADILKKYYGASTTEPAKPAPSTSQDSSGAIRPVAASPAASRPVYHVRGKEEMIYEIAQRTLGKGDRWPEIYQLNKDLDTTKPVPVGTELRLPADGRGD